MQDITTLGLNGGFNSDIDKAYFDTNTYLRAENFTATSKGGETLGALENSKGNELVSNISFGAGYELVGYANVVKDIVFFVADGANSKIYCYKEDGSLELKYSDEDLINKLGFSLEPEHRIVAVGRQELTELNKVYWVDGIHELRYINLDKDYGNTIDGFLPIDSLSSIPETDLTADINTEVLPGAGSYESGKVFHAYQLFSNNGASSTISATSSGISLSQYATTGEGGDDKGEATSCAVNVTISGTSGFNRDVYDNIILYAIFYSETSAPVVNIVSTRPLSSSDEITFIDDGTIEGEITLEEFATLNQTSYIADAIASKDNYLFLGNIEENVFDSDILDAWDSRAYRFRSNLQTYLWESYDPDRIGNYLRVGDDFKVNDVNGVSDVSIGDQVPMDYSCINRYNNTFSYNRSVQLAEGSRYQKDGATLGGEGLNIKYSFADTNRIVDRNGADSDLTNDPVLNNDSDSYSVDGQADRMQMVECQIGEVYRVGIQFFNKKGQGSFVKWVGDIAFESTVSSLNDHIYIGTSTVQDPTRVDSKIKVIKFELLNAPSDPDIASWRIVRVRRTSADKTIVTNGVMESVGSFGSNTLLRPQPQRGMDVLTADPRIFKLVSPELIFNDPNISTLNNYKLTAYNFHTQRSVGNSFPDPEGKHWDSIVKYRGTTTFGDSTNMFNIVDSLRVTPSYIQNGSDYDHVSIGGKEYRNQLRNGDEHIAPGCTGYLVELDNDLIMTETNGLPVSLESTFAFNLVKNAEASRYGGLLYGDIQSNEYIKFSDVIPISQSTAYCLYGDVYSNMNYYISGIFDDIEGDAYYGYQFLNCYPGQSSIDIKRRLDRILKYKRNLSVTGGVNYDTIPWLQETVERGIFKSPDNYPIEIGDLYRYNTVYSAEDVSDTSFAKPQYFIESPHSPTKVIASQKKINGESQDSWLSYLPNDFIEVDASFGPLNNLLTMDNGLFFWQDKSFGKLAVNERSLIEDGSGAKLALGTGGVLERFDYYSTEIGNIEKYNISKSENAMVWLYTPKKSIYKFDGNLQELSTTKGVSKYVIDNTPVYPISISDYENQESVIKLDNNDVVVYDWLLDKFVGVYTFTPKWFVQEFDGNYLSSPDGATFYRHNSNTVTRANYYGQDNKSKIKHVAAEGFTETKVFDVLNWHSTSIGKSEDAIEFEAKFDMTSGSLSQELFNISLDSLYGERIRVVFDLQLITDFTENNLQGVDVRTNYDTFADVRLSIPITTSVNTYDSGVIPGTISPGTQVFGAGGYTFSGDYFIKEGTRFRLSNVKVYTEAGQPLPISSISIYNNFDVERFGGDVNRYDDTFDTYRIYNDYQNTDWQPINWKRKERTFTSIIPRDRVNQPQSANVDIFSSSNLDEAQQFKRRMRDKYITIDMEYTNKPDTTFSFPYINVGYRRSSR